MTNNAAKGRRLEHRVRDELYAAGWPFVMRSAASKGPADLLAAHPEYGVAMFQIGTTSKQLGPADRHRLITAAHLCSALPIVARIAPRQATHYLLVTLGPPKEWLPWTP